jgi:hypothetical protein
MTQLPDYQKMNPPQPFPHVDMEKVVPGIDPIGYDLLKVSERKEQSREKRIEEKRSALSLEEGWDTE